ncbi:MAG: VanZ family protein [Sulfurovum sp.]|nr:VanZ family protein [Sulfurovum sp.]
MRKSKLYRYQIQFKILFWLAIIISYIFAVLPADVAPSIPELSDKAHHVFAFVVLGLLLRLGYKVNYWYAFIILVAYGAFIEFSQLFSINRFADVKDILADLVGTFIGLRLYKYLNKVM